MNLSFRVNGIATTLRRSCYLSASIALAAYSLPSAFAQQWIEDSSDIPYLMEKAADGSAYQVRFLSTEGVNYYIQSSEDCITWSDDIFYRGLGNTITQPLFPLPQNDGSGGAPVDPANFVPLIHGNFSIQRNRQYGTRLRSTYR